MTFLTAVAAFSACDAWAVGYASFLSQGPQTVVERWNGTAWTAVASPDPAGTSGGNNLVGLSMTSPSSGWAVGWASTPATSSTMIVRWNGTSWGRVRSPDAAGYNYLTGVLATSATNAWAAGYTNDNGHLKPLLLHWNGRSWALEKVPYPPGGDVTAGGLAASSAQDAWLTGAYLYRGHYQTLTEHWNGRSWRLVASPNVGELGSYLNSITEISADNVWAVGSYLTGSYATGGLHNRTLAEHWNGRTWSVIATPNPGQLDDVLYGLAATSATNVWAVGESETYPYAGSLTEHWNGARWQHVTSQNLPGTNVDTLNAVALVAGGGLAVGYYHNINDPNPYGVTLLPLAEPCCAVP